LGHSVIGFYTKNGKVRPITRRRKPLIWKPPVYSGKRPSITYTDIKQGVEKFLLSTPAAREIYAGYEIAKLIYDNRERIAEYLSAFSSGESGRISSLLKDDLRRLMSAKQGKFLTDTLVQIALIDLKPIIEKVASIISEELTDWEMDYVERFL
ncbi:MAG: hypothetical protein ACUVTD_09600, partial [Nitrososphaerales archaeon]